MRIGTLALQGDFALHLASLRRLGVEGVEVRRPGQLDDLDGLILPGGESSTMWKLLDPSGLRESLVEFARSGRAMLGTCAGLILMAKEALDPAQNGLAILDAVVRRNAYGRQLDSFEADGEFPADGIDAPLRMVFIRAPRISALGMDVEVLMEHRGEPVLVRQDNILGATFHPEMTGDTRIHAYFTSMI